MVPAPALAEAAIDLPWLSPCAAALVGLVQLPATAVWPKVRSDPGLVLLLVRQRGGNAADFRGLGDFGSLATPFIPDALRDPGLLEAALHFLHQPGFVDWNQPALLPVYQTCLLQARLAHFLAGHLEDCNPDCAWVGGLLAPLGWLTACAVDPARVEACRRHPDFARHPAAIQQHCWGLDHTAIARRLCRRWGLPNWLATIVGHLGLPAGIAQTLGADARLFQVVQLAADLVQQQENGLGLVIGATAAEIMNVLGLATDVIDAGLEIAGQPPASVPLTPWQAPASLALLPDYLRLALEHGRQDGQRLLERLQNDVDQLQNALEEQCASEKERLASLKLKALAELAAGAGHEINNPLAVISGQAQYLMGRETDPARHKSLQTIIGQAKRIHQILSDLMQFARPSPPQKQYLGAGELVRAVAESLQELAGRLQVQLVCPEPPPSEGRLHVDPAQVRLALNCLLRNALEAAPAEGWAGVRVQAADSDSVEFIVEDNGPGPTPAAREHMFDPFFSGRTAGRGRGLGLATAWRLARQNGGDVRFEDIAPGPSRFVLRLPLVIPPEEKAGHQDAGTEHPGANGCQLSAAIML